MRRTHFAYLWACLAVLIAKTALTAWPLEHPLANAPLLGWPNLLLVLALGAVALWLAERWGCAAALDPRVGAGRRWLAPALLGLVFAGVEIAVSLIKGYPNIHVPFPGSVAAYGAFGMAYEIRHHLIPLGLALGLGGSLLLRGRNPNLVYFVAAVAVSLVEPIGQIGGLRAMGLIGGPGWTVFFFVFIFAANVTPVYLFRRGGLFALLTFRMANYALWHVIWPAIYFSA